jgi:hypothetical protein
LTHPFTPPLAKAKRKTAAGDDAGVIAQFNFKTI